MLRIEFGEQGAELGAAFRSQGAELRAEFGQITSRLITQNAATGGIVGLWFGTVQAYNDLAHIDPGTCYFILEGDAP